jgi:hypothetical protein
MLKFENSHHNDFLYSLLQVCAVFGNLHLFVYVLLLGCSMSLLFHMENADLKKKMGLVQIVEDDASSVSSCCTEPNDCISCSSLYGTIAVASFVGW